MQINGKGGTGILMKRLLVSLVVLGLFVNGIAYSAEEPILPFQKIKAIAITKGIQGKDPNEYCYRKKVGNTTYYFMYFTIDGVVGNISLTKKTLDSETTLDYSPRLGYAIERGPKFITPIDKMVIWDIAVKWLKECDE
jgi:hypothetical protein